MSTSSFEDLEVRRQRALEEAAAWLVRLQSETLTTTDRSALTDWLRESPLHVAAMLRVSHTDHALTSFDAWDTIPVDPSTIGDSVIEWPSCPPARKQLNQHTFSTPRRPAVTMLTIVLLSAMAATLWWQGLIGGPVFRTSTGERRDVALQDGSTLRLGPQTRVRVRLTKSERWVALEEGEAVFKVAKDPARPFFVDADRARVRAVGTEFGVEKRDGAVLVTVAEGRVAVSQNAASLLLSDRDPNGSAVVALVAGDQLSVPSRGTRRSSIRKVDGANSLAWASGRLIFENESLATVIERFNQYNAVQLKVLDPHLAERRISGSFDATDLESLLAFLHSALPANAQHTTDGREITLAPATNTGGR
jgi:transmembrane sensor